MTQFDRDYFDVPVADVATNATVIEVIGNKVDAAVTTATTTKSLMAYIKGALSLLATAATDRVKIPHSDGTATFNGTALAAINAEVDTALETAVPNTPTAKSINDILSNVVVVTLTLFVVMSSISLEIIFVTIVLISASVYTIGSTVMSCNLAE